MGRQTANEFDWTILRGREMSNKTGEMREARKWLLVLEPYHIDALKTQKQIKSEGQNIYIRAVSPNPINASHKRYKPSYTTYEGLKLTKKFMIYLCIEDVNKLLEGKDISIDNYIIILNLDENRTTKEVTDSYIKIRKALLS